MPARVLRRLWSAKPLWQTALWLLLAIVSWLAFSPKPPPSASLGWDKLNHASAFTALAFCAARAHAGTTVRIVAGLLAYGVVIEIVQTFVPGRSGEAADLLADAIGIAVGLVLVRGLDRAIQSR